MTSLVAISLTLVGFLFTFLSAPFILNSVYGQLYTSCEGYRAYLDWKGISISEGMTNTTLVDERIAALELGQEPGTTGPVSEQELICLKEIREPQKQELREIIEQMGGLGPITGFTEK